MALHELTIFFAFSLDDSARRLSHHVIETVLDSFISIKLFLVTFSCHLAGCENDLSSAVPDFLEPSCHLTNCAPKLFDVLMYFRYKESLTKSTKGFRERLRTRGGIMQDLGARAREMSAGVVRAIERMSVESATDHPDAPNSPTDHPDAPNSPPGHPSDPILHPPDRLHSGSASEGSPRIDSDATLPTATLIPTPELRSGSEY
jgi:hypothetical protein